jgi:hypothetical protein
LAVITDDNLRAKFYCIQEQFATIIFQDVMRKGGCSTVALRRLAMMKYTRDYWSKVTTDRSLWQEADYALYLIRGSVDVSLVM